MDSDDDFQQFSPSRVASPFIPERKLKRLKKSVQVSEDSVRNHFQSDVSELSPSKVDSEDSDVSIVPELEETNESWERRLAAANKLNSAHDASGEEGRVGVKRALDFLSAIEDADNIRDEEDMEDKEDYQENTEDNEDYVIEKDFEDQNTRVEEKTGDSRVDEFDKDHPILDVFEEEKEKKNKKNKEDKKFNKTRDARNFTATTSKMKGRKELMTELRAESQKLLRETRDASFKPIPMVAKSVSSVLEKIRKRKLELTKKSVMINYSVIDNSDDDNDDDLLGRLVLEHNSDMVGSEKGAESMNEETVKPHAFVEDEVNTANACGSSYEKNKSKDDNIPSCRDSGEELKRPFRLPIDDTEQLFSNSQLSADDEIPDKSPNRPQEEFLAPSILTMNLKLDSAPPDYESDEEDNDKENVDPCRYRLADSSSSPTGDPVKAFVDDEAEEEDDSDNDMRFQDTEEEEDTDVEELNDMIETGYKEKPIDSEIRNQLHQKWLENQDAVGTEKLMQKLKCGSKLIKESSLEDEDEEEDENNVSDNEATEGSLQPNARMNLRKMKQMVCQMFTDADDTYFSDDEETERRLAQQCLVEKAGEKTNFLSPADDESCREVFGLIKKLNIVPETKKKITSTSYSSAQLPVGNKNISSKPSFLGRSSNQSLAMASSKKHGSNNSRSFIFERDNSSSRSETTIAEETHDAVQKENKPARVGPARPSFSQSQAKSSTQMVLASGPNSGISLFEMLRQSSLRSKQCSLDIISSQSESVFEAFKLDKAPAKKRVKMEGRR